MGSNGEVEEILISPAELVNYPAPLPSGKVVPVYDGDVIDLGGRPLQAIALPGHTPGSTALLDKNSGMLFSGDPIQDGRIFMFGPMRNLAAYIVSLKRLDAFASQIREIWPCHGTCPVPPSIVGELIHGAEQVERGEIAGRAVEFHGLKAVLYDIGAAGFLCDA